MKHETAVKIVGWGQATVTWFFIIGYALSWYFYATATTDRVTGFATLGVWVGSVLLILAIIAGIRKLVRRIARALTRPDPDAWVEPPVVPEVAPRRFVSWSAQRDARANGAAPYSALEFAQVSDGLGGWPPLTPAQKQTHSSQFATQLIEVVPPPEAALVEAQEPEPMPEREPETIFVANVPDTKPREENEWLAPLQPHEKLISWRPVQHEPTNGAPDKPIPEETFEEPVVPTPEIWQSAVGGQTPPRSRHG